MTMNNRRASLCGLLLALSGVHGFAVRANTKPAQADAIRLTVQRLKTIKTDPMNPRIPDDARTLLKTLKHQLRDLIESTLNDHGTRNNPNPAQVRVKVLSALKRRGVSVALPQQGMSANEYFSTTYVYGQIDGVTIKRRANLPGLIVATVTLDLQCGEDTSIYLFRKHGSHWRLDLAQEANDYAEISGAQGRFDYALSPPDRFGRFVLVPVNVNPWCTSKWQSIRYAVLRIGRTPESPNVIARGDETIFLGNDHPYRLRVAERGFRLDFDGESNPDEIVRRHHLVYRIDGARARLVRNN
jgi:hypothetical protein